MATGRIPAEDWKEAPVTKTIDEFLSLDERLVHYWLYAGE